MTQPDSSSLEEQSRKKTKSQAAVHRVATIVFAAALIVLSFYIFLAWQLAAWQMVALSALIAAFTAANFAAMRTIKNGNPNRGSWMILIGMMVVFPGAVFLIDQISIIFGGALIALTVTVSTQTLPSDKARRANLYGIIVGTLTALIDLLPLNYRLVVPEIQAFVPAITTLIVIIVAFLAIRQARGNIADFWRASIRNRLTTIIVGTAIIPVLAISVILGLVTYRQTRAELTQTTFDRLAAIQAIKLAQLESYFDERSSDMEALRETVEALRNEAFGKIQASNTLKKSSIARLFKDWSADVRDVASDPGVVAGMQDMTIGFQELGANTIRSLYLKKGELDTAGDGSLYSTAHFEQHGFFTGYVNIHGYLNAILIDPDGNIIYNVYKSDSFGTNLATGPYQDSNLTKLYQNLKNAPLGTIYIADVGTFEESTRLFIGTPIYNGNQFIGILAYQISITQINEIMTENAGLGETSETFLVAREEDGRITLRSDRLAVHGDFIIGFDITQRAPQFVQDAADGKAGRILSAGGQDEAVLAIYEPLNIEGINWAMIGKVNAEEALVPSHSNITDDYLTLYAENYGYADIYLIGSEGDAFYTVAKKSDYQTNLINGEYKNTNLGELTQEILANGESLLTDLAFYEPSGGIPVSFIGIPIYENPDNTGRLQMVVAAQLPIEDINRIMNEASGLGESGESYIIGQDFLGRMDTRFLDVFGVETTVLNEEYAVNTEAVRSALAGESGQGTITNFRDLPVLSVWSPFVVHEAHGEHAGEEIVWAVMTEIDQSEALLAVNQLASGLALIIGLTALAIGAAAVFLGTRFGLNFVEPILSLTDTATQIAAGNLDLRLATDSQDEIGVLTNTFNTMTEELQGTLAGLEERVAARTKDLATVAEISTVTATIREPEEMLTNMVHLTQRGFGLYHAHVFTFNEEQDLLSIVACGYRQGDEHEGTHGTTTIPMGQEQSLVALAARTRQPVIVNDVRNEPGWLPNPLLPETRAELAVPMIVGDELLGVLDVQSERLNAFTEEDANIQMTLASQIATALQNALTYEETQKRAELETLANVIGQRIQRTTSIEDTLQTAIRELGIAIGAKRVKANLRSSLEEKTAPVPSPEPALSTEAKQKANDAENTSDPKMPSVADQE